MTLWKRRFARFMRGFADLEGAPARARYVTGALRKALELLLQEIAAQIGGTTNTGLPASVSLASGIARANTLGHAYTGRLQLVAQDGGPRINFVIPMLSPAVIFGGYISLFNFAARLAARGHAIRFIVSEGMSHTKEELLALLAGFPAAVFVLQKADVIRAITHTAYAPIPASRQDVFIAYSAFAALLCHRACEELDAGRFIYYLQEEEGHFHAHNAFRATIEYVYTLPHVPVFNSEMLEDYFRAAGLGAFAARDAAPRYMTFRHALSTARSPTLGEIAGRAPRKLLFFARPEQHAERNLFEIGLIALRICCESGLFPAGEWEFHAVGAMTDGYALDLGRDHALKFLPRRPLAEYAESLYGYDVGLSLMFAPHPSVPNFEMAAAGMPTVTTTFANRPQAAMQKLCPNFIAVPPHIKGVVDGIHEAVQRAGDYETRIRNAQFAWPRSWQESFSDAWLDEFDRLLVEVSPGFRQADWHSAANFGVTRLPPAPGFSAT